MIHESTAKYGRPHMLIAVPSLTSRAIVAFLATVGWTVASQADSVSVRVQLSGVEEVPPVQTAGSGVAEFVYDPETRTVKWVVTYNGLSGPATMAHFHGPATQATKGHVVTWLPKQGSPADSPLTGQTILTPEQAVQFAAGQQYANRANRGEQDARFHWDHLFDRDGRTDSIAGPDKSAS